nr:hypothetical protein [Streptomyces harenosi]
MPATALRRLAAIAVGLALALASVIVPVSTAVAGTPPSSPALDALAAPAAEPAPADSTALKTWWHDNYEFNTTGPVPTTRSGGRRSTT